LYTCPSNKERETTGIIESFGTLCECLEQGWHQAVDFSIEIFGQYMLHVLSQCCVHQTMSLLYNPTFFKLKRIIVKS